MPEKLEFTFVLKCLVIIELEICNYRRAMGGMWACCQVAGYPLRLRCAVVETAADIKGVGKLHFPAFLVIWCGGVVALTSWYTEVLIV